jgi:hypothetical protein
LHEADARFAYPIFRTRGPLRCVRIWRAGRAFLICYLQNRHNPNSSEGLSPFIRVKEKCRQQPHDHVDLLFLLTMVSIRSLGLVYHHNVNTLRHSPLKEVSGSLGDLGTLLPLMIALARQGSITLSTTLVFTGVFNIITGLYFGVPLPVQPMKVRKPSLQVTRSASNDTGRLLQPLLSRRNSPSAKQSQLAHGCLPQCLC